MMKKNIAIIFFSTVLLSSCYYDNEEQLYPNTTTSTTTNPADTAVVSYTATIAPMMTSNCATAGCHESGGRSPNLSNWAGVSGSKVIVRIRANDSNNPMPASGLMSSSDRAKLNSWIDKGAPNN